MNKAVEDKQRIVVVQVQNQNANHQIEESKERIEVPGLSDNSDPSQNDEIGDHSKEREVKFEAPLAKAVDKSVDDDMPIQNLQNESIEEVEEVKQEI